MSGREMVWFLVCSSLGCGGAAAGAYGAKLLAAVLLLSGFMGIVWVLVDSLWARHIDEIEERANLVRERTRFAQVIASADREARYFMAHEWPEMGVEFGEQGLVYLLKDGVNTQILLSFLRVFLEDSSEIAFVDLRNYNDDKYLQERFEVSRDKVRAQWHLAAELLAGDGYLKPDSMAGNRTWQWTSPDHYRKLVRRYVGVRELERMT